MPDMEEEKHHDEVQREASRAGGRRPILLFVCIAILMGLTLWPFNPLLRLPRSS